MKTEGTVRRGPGSRIAWIALSIFSATAYGIINDQVTATLSPEYFSVFKRRNFDMFLQSLGLSEAPVRIQAIAVGTIATWWFGMLLGSVLSIAGAAGPRPKVGTKEFLRVVLSIMAFSFVLSLLAGIIGFAAEPALKPTARDWPFLEGIHEVRSAFAVGFWHDGAYLGGIVGTLLGVLYLRKLRSRMCSIA